VNIFRKTRGQNQESGDSSLNVQSGRDTTINNHSGVSVVEAMQILQHVVQRELEVYAQASQNEIRVRVSELRTELLDRISQLDDHALSSFREPDVQAVLLDAQVAYARSGRDDVRRALVDLVAARCVTQTEDMQAVVINEAVATVRKVTRGGIAILTVVFVVGQVKNQGIDSLEALDDWASKYITPFISQVPRMAAEYRYLSATGTATFEGLIDRPLCSLLSRTYPGLFQNGMTEEDIPEVLLQANERRNRQLFTPCVHDTNRIQVAALDDKIAREKIGDAEDPDLVDLYVKLLERNRMQDHDCEVVIRKKLPVWTQILDLWQSIGEIRRITLTPVGVAIAHCNWTNATQAKAPMSIWMSGE
jgi:hypothetical protein